MVKSELLDVLAGTGVSPVRIYRRLYN